MDSLALCQLSYLKFDGMVSDVRHNGPSVTLQEIAKRPDVDQLFEMSVLRRRTGRCSKEC